MDDLISRQAAIEHWRLIIDATSTDSGYNMGFVDGLEFCISHLSTMPSVQPERKTGHWVEIGDEPYDEWECDVCGFAVDGSGCIDPEEYRDVYKFCPNCGADMRGEQE